MSASTSFKRRRRHKGPSSRRYRASLLIPVEAARPVAIGTAEIAAGLAVGIVAVALIVLIWIVTGRAARDQRVEIRDRAEQALTAQAAIAAESVSHELLMIDQSLSIIQAQWQQDSGSVDLRVLAKTMPALTAVTDDLFIADAKHIVRQDILPSAVGQGVGAAYVTFPHGSLERFRSDGTQSKNVLRAERDTGTPILARRALVYLVRLLDHPRGWLVGASFRSAELTKLFAEARLGYGGVAALVDTRHGMVQTVIGPAAEQPHTNLSRSPLYALIKRAKSGTWIGKTSIDNVYRLHAFHRIPKRDMAVVVGADYQQVMAPATALNEADYGVAMIASILVVVTSGTILWGLYTFRAKRRHNKVFDRNRKELERLRGEETGLTAQVQLNAGRLQAVLDATADGVALFDSGYRLEQWNQPFQRGAGVELAHEMSLDMLLHAQAAAGLFGDWDDPEAEIAARSAALRAGEADGVRQRGPHDDELVLRGLPIAGGGLALLLSGVTRWIQMPVVTAPEPDVVVSVEPSPVAPIEW